MKTLTTSPQSPVPTSVSEAGRSLIEMLGVLAIAGVMTAGAITMYQVVRTRQIRMVATEDMKTIADNAKMLYAARRDYTGISTEYLVKAGAMRNEKSPLVGNEFSVMANPGDEEFQMIFSGMDFKTCSWLASVKLDWAEKISVNGYFESPATYCRKADKNEVAIWVK
jgi:Tfp pilus assembly protein PilE